MSSPPQYPFSFLTPLPPLLIGSGPTGLFSSLLLHTQNIPHRLIDISPSPGLTSRAMVIHARTMELYSLIPGLTSRILSLAHPLTGLAVGTGGSVRARVGFKNGGAGVSPFPSVYSLPQDVHERVLLEILGEMGGGVERGVELLTAVEEEDGVSCVLRRVDSGKREEVTASFVLGCDGAHSKVRTMAGIQMEGGTYAQRFFVADVELARGLPTGDNMNVNMSRRDFLLVFPFHFVGEKEEEGAGEGGVRKLEGKRARLLGFVPQHRLDEEGNLLEGEEGKLGFEDVRSSVENAAPQIQVESVRWFSSYRVHHRVAGGFRSKGVGKGKGGGRMFVLGDAAHLHSPVGGQGMNTGLGDAANLAWKIALVWHGRAPVTLLDTYEPERKAFAELLVATTDRFFTIVTNTGLLGWFARNVWMPYVFPLIMKVGGARMERMFFGRISQTRVQYPQSKLSEAAETTGGKKVVGGSVKPGERLPWVEVSSTNNNETGNDTKKSEEEEEETKARLLLGNYAPLRQGKWQVHVYGSVEKSLEQALYDRGVPLYVFPYTTDAAAKGLARDAVYVIRPDIYISFVGHAEDQMFLERFLEKWGIGLQN